MDATIIGGGGALLLLLLIAAGAVPSTMSMPITWRNRQSTKRQVNVMCLSPSPRPHVW